MKVAIAYPVVYDLGRYRERRKEFPPFGPLYLGAALENIGVEVKIFKILSKNEILDLRDYDVVAFSIPSSVTYNLMKEVRFNSLYSEDSLILAGGVHPTLYPKQTLLEFKPHAVAIGPGEETIVELLKVRNRHFFSKIKGVCFLENSSVCMTPQRNQLEEINSIPFPARHLLDEADVTMDSMLSNTNLKAAHIIFSRGCPFSCRYCAVSQKKPQCRSGQNIRTELKKLVSDYQIDAFFVADDNFTIHKIKVFEICNSISDLNLKWSTLARVDAVNQEILAAMKESGCEEIRFGVESGSQKMLNSMRKNISTAQIYKAIQATHAAGIKVKIFILHGYPGENSETTEETISLLKKVAPMVEGVSVYRFVPLPGSYVYRNAKKFQLLLSGENTEWDKLHIYHNNYHWWGNQTDFEDLNRSYEKLKIFVENLWPYW